MDNQVPFLINHLFLPSQLPGGSDASSSKQLALIDFVLDTLRRYLLEADIEHHASILAAISLMQNIRTSKGESEFLQENGVLEILQQRVDSDTVAPFHVTAQNAGVLIGKMNNSMVFEFFELAPTNFSVFSGCGRLVRRFPATAMRVSLDVFEKPEFQSVLASTLVKMSQQTVSEMKPKVVKARQKHDEDRDTTDPRIVTEFLVSFLAGLGEPVDVDGVCKNTREEVLWKNSKLPWRRSELWLLIRVSLQLTMTRVAGNSVAAYKTFMVFLLARLLQRAVREDVSSDLLHVMTAKVCRRLKKLQDPQHGKWLKSITRAVSEASDCMSQRWQGIQKCSESQLDLGAISRLKMGKDDCIPLGAMDGFISTVSQRSHQETFDFRPTAGVCHLDASELPEVCQETPSVYMPFHLAMIEDWIGSNLNGWIEKHPSLEESFGRVTIQNVAGHRRALGGSG
ncbi:hypothetical protein XA68_17218 [Ophiocordyceps unilateralis]|uniref:DUF6606 domain-containing protein n=1 Tax=Ophiocordyceps unilateralis TaxID=268505 RepID=A0A2A9P587_OPHUN|nr:hypothetical protein XA68_17218 [Ophiocordyceps unilateralis]